MADHYSTLGVSASATADEIHRAYRALAMKYHPDRNADPAAVSQMILINEAYAVLSEAVRRRKYDQRERLSCASDMALPIVAAARDAILRQRWTVLRDDGSQLLLEAGSRRLRINFVDRLTNAALRTLGRQVTEFTVVLAVEVERPINLSLQVAVVDLLHSAHLGAPFPDDRYRAVFAAFISR